MKKKAQGTRGSWFATVDGEELPCVHQHWLQGVEYDDPHAKPGSPVWDPFIKGIALKRRVILTSDRVTKRESDTVPGFERTGYIAVYAVDDVRVEDSHLKFKLTKRECHLE